MSTFALRLPESLHEHAKKLAEQDQTSLNQFIAVAVAEKVSAMDTATFFEQRAARGDRVMLKQILTKVPDAPPTAGDEISATRARSKSR